MQKIKNLTIDKSIAVVIFIVLAILPLILSDYSVHNISKYLTYMIAALALDLLWGYSGMMNLGFAVFFGIGGYMMGLSLACQNGMPAFMSFAGVEKLPAFYQLLTHVPIAFLFALIFPAAIALVLGWFIFTSKIKGVFYNLITLAFAAMVELLLKSNQGYTGGESGVNGIASGMSVFGNISIDGWYYIGFISLVAVYLLCLYLTECRFGKVIRSIRDNEARLQFLGYNPATFKLAVFAIAGAIAGFAGALYVPVTSFITVDNAGIAFSTTMLVWLAVGGRGNLTGAMLGALIVSFLQSTLSSALSDMWQLILGVILIVVVLFLPKGIVGTLADWQYNRRTRRMEKN